MFWKKKKKTLLFAVVSEDEAIKNPYPYVYVEKDGRVRELHNNERKYLEAPFHPADGSRPHVKDFYAQKNLLGDIRGYCLRSKIPPHIQILPPPNEDPTNLLAQKLFEDTVKFAEEHGVEIVEEDGNKIFRRKKPHN